MISNSYRPSQVTCLFTPFEGDLLTVEAKENMLRDGVYYGDVLSEEERPDQAYLEVFDNLTSLLATRLATPIVQLAAHFDATRPPHRPIVLLSLARAGTPIGVVVTELLRQRFGREVHHYSVSVLHNYGLDPFAMNEVLSHHSAQDIVFLDGWVSQGRITRAVEESAGQWEGVSSTLHCLSDPSGIQDAVATRQDILLPSAVLNANVSGLLSRTVHNPKGFHFSQTYDHFADVDRTQPFIEAMLAACELTDVVPRSVRHSSAQRPLARAQVEAFCATHATDEHSIKVGIGEVSRSLLRRQPSLVVVDPTAEAEAEHIFYLGQKRNIDVVVRPLNGPFRAFSILT